MSDLSPAVVDAYGAVETATLSATLHPAVVDAYGAVETATLSATLHPAVVDAYGAVETATLSATLHPAVVDAYGAVETATLSATLHPAVVDAYGAVETATLSATLHPAVVDAYGAVETARSFDPRVEYGYVFYTPLEYGVASELPQGVAVKIHRSSYGLEGGLRQVVTVDAVGGVSTGTLTGGIRYLQVATHDAAGDVQVATIFQEQFLVPATIAAAGDIRNAVITFYPTSPIVPATVEAVGAVQTAVLSGYQLHPFALDAAGSVQLARAILPRPTGPKINVIYSCTLTGAQNSLADLDLSARMTSFQASYSRTAQTYLSVVLRGVSDIIDDITDRPDGEIIIKMGYRATGEMTVPANELVRASFDQLQTAAGSSSSSATIAGYFAAPTTIQATTVALRNVSTRALANGKLTFRSQVDHLLKPGDTATWGSDSFLVGRIQFAVSATQQTFDVFED